MLIITADDFGLNIKATDSIILTYKARLITSISAMVYMSDSVRASEYSFTHDGEIGLHLNLTTPFSGPNISSKLLEHHRSIARFLLSNKFAPIIYNPFLRNSFEYVIRLQEDEFSRLYKKFPDFYNGHHHMHLCSNVILDKLLPRKIPIRRTFTFRWGEKDPFNIIYRRLLDRYIDTKHISTDAFFGIDQIENLKYNEILQLSRIKNVELMIHPHREFEYIRIRSGKYIELLNRAELGGFRKLYKHDDSDK